jgi:phosphatidylglycerophosphate synthase
MVDKLDLVGETAGGRHRWDLAAAVKPADAWWTVLVIDPVAMRLLPLLLRWKILTANLVTSVAFVVGIFSVAAFASGHFAVGAVLFEVRFVLDCLDGKIARVRHISSPLGAAFDRIGDALTVPAAYAAIGLALALRDQMHAQLALLPALMSAMVTVLGFSLELVRRRSTPDHGAWLLGHGTLVGWFRRHRLTLVPSTVEAETVGLFLAPLVLSGGSLGDAELATAGLYVVLGLLNLGLIGSAARTAGLPGPAHAARRP